MKTGRSLFLVASLVVAVVFGPCLAESATDLEKKVEDLAKRVESLERRLAAPAPTAATPPPVPRPTTPVASGGGREAAMALYTRIDLLVAAGKLDQANLELTAWDEKFAGTPDADWTRTLHREMAVVGKAAPTDWKIEKWYQGESEIKLDSQHPTLVVFWEAWCPHCREEVPKLTKLRDQYRAKGLQVLGVTRITQTSTEATVKAFLAESGVSYPIAKETGELADYFGVKGIPAAAMVKDGKIVWRGHPLRLTEALLNNWF